ncbi:putative solute-binding protein [Aquirhabdus sp.]|uniref:putative solute-binding protein n=1 Tax=Aquirhabdus sp. TaxID=2824160 RepID=UPI00396CA859
MKHIQSLKAVVCTSLLTLIPLLAVAAPDAAPAADQKQIADAVMQVKSLINASAPDGSKIDTAPPTPEEIKKYTDMFGRAKKLIDDPKTWNKIPTNITLCVFSPEGAKGKGFDFAMKAVKDLPKFTQVAKNLGVDLNVKMTSPLDMHIDMASAKAKRKASTDVKIRVYTNEKIASEDFKAGQCDGVAMSNLRAKEYNDFIGSLDAIGAIPSYKHLTEAIQLLSKPEAAKYMVNKDYEVVAIIPVGAAYIMVNDRKINTLAKAAGKKIAVLDFDKTQAKMVQKIGAQPVSVDFTTLSGKFNNGQVDIMAGPALIFKPLELYKGMTAPDGTVKGAIVRFPLIQITGVMMMHRGKFPDGVGQLVREFSAMQTPMAYPFITETEQAIEPKYWMDVPAADKAGYIKLMRESRISLTKEGLYDKNMMSFLKKIRCQFDPSNYECSMTDE